ncbi:MAG: Lrp/AsnC family transcriptional regulator [Oceanospirillaceae bacterium]|jgi:DNA-binding Lrp family transcriptional regulator|nr:Lrp/AsnC family transcriptional regulator [Oceanospirillaceae bacterium]MBT4444188.1 Lrp/AsnC family transcriptional regulator [Oceanospirillaceae bacterium]MBT6077721.1 Lrp/AsnC family transcriptional regulator [Oceanospirillaceae bacterium]MBT7330209.1 Lrp/AsnC family transcriptional regulator [Oceanospirillaceae bacterium]
MKRLHQSDRTILELLQKNSRVKLESIASKTGLSVATIQRRVKHFKSTSVIQQETAVISQEAVGYGMTFLIMVELEQEKAHQLDSFRKKVTAEPQVQQCYYITGEADFALIALAKSIDDFEQLTHRLFFDDANVKRFHTSVVMNRTKTGMTVPLELDIVSASHSGSV